MRGSIPAPAALRLRRFALPPVVWVGLAVVAWGGVAWLGLSLLAADPPRAGFDLDLVLRAARDVAAGRSPYDPEVIGGTAPEAVRLFYAYPPAVAQAAALVAGLPLGVALAALGVLAIGGLALVAAALSRYFAPWLPTIEAVGPTVAAAAILLPFAIAILFGNLDALFPFVYGAALLAALGVGRWPLVGGLSIAAASIAKLYPGGIGVWFLVRAVRERGMRTGAAARGAAVAIAAAVAVVAASLLVGGAQPWIDYVAVARVVAGSDIVDPRSMGPAAQVALWVGGGEGLARTLHIAVLVLAVGSIVWAAWCVDDPVASLGVAAGASLVLLPITWYHYAAALIPFALAAVLRDRSARPVGLVAGAAVLAAAGIVLAPLLWAAAAIVIAATRRGTERD